MLQHVSRVWQQLWKFHGHKEQCLSYFMRQQLLIQHFFQQQDHQQERQRRQQLLQMRGGFIINSISCLQWVICPFLQEQPWFNFFRDVY